MELDSSVKNIHGVKNKIRLTDESFPVDKSKCEYILETINKTTEKL